MRLTGGDQAPARPRPVTIAGVLAALACALLVVSLFDAMSQVRSAETQESVRDFLAKPPGDGLGLRVADVVSLLRGLVLLSGALAATGTVLAVFTLQRHRGARVGLSVVAFLLLFTASFVTGFLPVVVAVSATMLWNRESRDWFAGRPPTPRPAAPSRDGRPDGPDMSTPPTPATLAAWAPPPHGQKPGEGPSPASHAFGTAPAPGTGWSAPGYAAPGQDLRRPLTVTVAAWLTWVFAGLAVLFFTLLLVTVLADRTRMLDVLRGNSRVAESGLSIQQILGTLWVMGAVGLFWSLSAVVLAVLAFRRVNAARLVLAVSAGLCAVLALLAVPFGWPNAAAAVATVVLLFRRDSNRWYARAPGPDLPRAPDPPDPPTQPPTQPPQRPTGKPPVW